MTGADEAGQSQGGFWRLASPRGESTRRSVDKRRCRRGRVG